MKIAVEGCAHGELDKIYETITYLEEQNNFKVDLLIICGDFQAVRNRSDLTCMAVPNTYKKMNTFFKYYSGEKKAPILTVFVGGNHEASNYLLELPFGGWVCPNIYYMGYANVINVGDLRIGGLSGIYKGNDYLKGRFEHLPFDESTKRSIYHIRNIDVFRLKQISEPIDIFVSHDWPRGVYHFGNKNALLKRKRFFKEEIENNTLGSRPSEELLHRLKPKYWFAAHLHCKYAALVPHDNPDSKKTSFTKFLALDKCLPKRQFLQILDIGKKLESQIEIKYDLEWLCILHSTNHLININNNITYMPGPGGSERWNFRVNDIEKKKLEELENFDQNVPINFQITAPIYNPSSKIEPLKIYTNPQTIEFCHKFQLTDPIELILLGKSQDGISIREFINDSEMNITINSQTSINPDEITFDNDSDIDSISKPSSPNSEVEMSGVEDLYEVPLKDNNEISVVEPKIEFNDSFFIDKIGAEISLEHSIESSSSLGERQNIHLQYCSTPQHNKIEKLDFPKIEVNENTEKKNSIQSSPVSNCCKRFKRRNQEIYGASYEDNL